MAELGTLRLALYGGGKMGMAMLEGWLREGMKAENVAVYDPFPSEALKAKNVTLNPVDFHADVSVLAVKPQVMPALFEEQKFDGDGLVISVAAGLPLAFFEARVGASRPIIRAMPNTPAAIGAGITAIIGNNAAKARELELAEALLGAVGVVVRLEREGDMDAVTGLSGSGPAYVFHMIEAMRAAGEAEGLSAELAHKLALATVYGAGQLAQQSHEDVSILRQNVTSPGGTTAAGLAVLMDEDNGLPKLMKSTVAAAAERSRELAK